MSTAKKPDWEIPPGEVEYAEKKVLGKGGYGSVCEGVYRKQTPVAVKKVAISGTYLLEDYRNEVEVWYRLRHPNVLQLLGVILDSDHVLFISPLMSKGDCANYLTSFSDGNERQCKAVALLRDIAIGMDALHAKGVVHTDLKPANVLVNDLGIGVITDFGFAKNSPLDDNDLLVTGSGKLRVEATKIPYHTLFRMPNSQERPGTAFYMPPERLERRGTTKQGDVYAFGIMIVTMWTDETAYPVSSTGIFDDICFKNLRPSIPDDMPEELVSLMKSCWDEDPSKRPNFTQIAETMKSIA
ncbi:hypothetical protein HDU93_000909, partial [Gonapodya sp. JEL0774]